MAISDLQAQSVTINEVVASNSGVIQDEDGDSPDWIELYNNGTSSVDLTGFGLSDDSSTPFKWVLPSIHLRPREYLLIFASGKDRREWLVWETIISQGDVWRYRLGNSEPPANWRSVEFDDSGWYLGSSGFGYGDNDDATVVPQVWSVYIRKTFFIDKPETIRQAWLHVDYDDGFVAYLNDIEIGRANLGTPGDHPAYNQPAATYKEAAMYQGGLPEKFELKNLSSIFRPGRNVLAIQVHNNDINSSDLTIIPFLTLASTEPLVVPGRGVAPFLPPLLAHLHTNFKISAAGEEIALRNAAGQVFDQVILPPLPVDVSYGRQPDGVGSWFYFAQPTPEKANTTPAYSFRITGPTFSSPGGCYSAPVVLTLTPSLEGSTIRYTTNGAEPTASSALYVSPITINRTTVIRAREFAGGALPGPIISHTYFIGENFRLPVVSLITDPSNLWDENTGIYVKGKNAEASFPYFGANFWQDWEKPVHVEFYEPSGAPGFRLDAGMKIYGGWSRGHAQKSLAIYAREKYGANKIEYPIFPSLPIQSFESFVLRNSGNDWTSTFMRDGMMQTLLLGTNVDLQAYRPATVFLNGEYWGILNIREKINEHYIAAHHGIDPDRIDFLENNADVIQGDASRYIALRNYLATTNMRADATYDSVAKLMDLDNYLDYMIAEIYYDNTDWPGNNLKYWRHQSPDGRWRWIMFDTDFGFGLYNSENYRNNTLEFALATNGPDWPNPPWSTFLLRKLLENPRFKIQFINRFADHLNTTFRAERVVHIIDSLRAILAPEMSRHRTKWRDSATNWESNIQVLRQFANQRGAFVKAHLLQKFQLPGFAKIYVKCLPAGSGSVRLNSLLIANLPWEGFYFQNVPIQLQAIPAPGFRFRQWSSELIGNGSSSIAVTPTSDLSITAEFEAAPTLTDSIIINEINYHSASDLNPGDWIELYNQSQSLLNLAGWTFKDGNDDHIFRLPANTVIEGNGFLVLCQNLHQFSTCFPEVANAVGDFSFGLDGNGELLRLCDPQGGMVDSLRYSDRAPWPTAADGNGVTLELKQPWLDNTKPENWQSSFVLGGTPGRANSIATGIDNAGNHPRPFRLWPNYPNPFNRMTLLEYELPAPAWVTIAIYNSQGQRVTTLVNEPQSAGEHRVDWQVAGTLTSGVYFAVATANTGTDRYIQSRKMIYLK